MSFAHPRKNISQFGLSEGDRVADLGAGAGHYTIEAGKKVGENGQVYAIEIQKKLVSKVESEAKEAGLSNVEVIWSDLEEVGGSTLKDEIMDAVIVSNVLFQITNKSTVLQEAKRILKPGGRLLLVDWSEAHGGVGPTPDHVVSESEARELCEKAGFAARQVISPGAHHYGVIFQKPDTE